MTQKIPENCGSGYCSCIECFRADTYIYPRTMRDAFPEDTRPFKARSNLRQEVLAGMMKIVATILFVACICAVAGYALQRSAP